MFGIGIDTSPARRLLDGLGKLPKGMKRELADVMRRAAQENARAAKAAMRSKAARRRKAGGSRRGEAPVSQTGETAKSIRAVRARRDGLAYKVESRFVGRFLETQLDRTFISRAIGARSEQTFAEVVQAIERTLERVGA